MRGLRTKEKTREKKIISHLNKVFDEEKEKIPSVDFVKQESLHVLHVDDDASFLRISKLILELENKFEIDTVTSVDEAFCKQKMRPYDAIVCDYEMPIKKGLDFLREPREQKTHCIQHFHRQRQRRSGD